MTLYVKDGARVWHQVDPDHTQTVRGRPARVAECGVTLLESLPAIERNIPEDLCPLCSLNPSEEQKKAFRRTYLVST
jgi:hypothetical protein